MENSKQNIPILQLKNITKNFGNTTIINNLSFDVYKGEFLTLLGASGCGKTTTLRIVAGLEIPDSGTVLLEDKDVTYTEPNKRDVNTVFQNYALFPNMTVAKNVAYSLKLKHKDKDEIKKTVDDMLKLVQLEGYGRRMPAELSGGQRQRVAIARASVSEPSVMLLDEPLGALDLQLRRQMQVELKRLQKHMGITFIYVTHDQEEAINMSDRIAVMRAGKFEQIGSPRDIYDHPKTSYVAEFVGSSNILTGTVKAIEDKKILIENAAGTGYAILDEGHVQVGQKVTFAVRSENIELNQDKQADYGLKATLLEKTFAGGLLRMTLKTQGGTEIIASSYGIDSHLQTGTQVVITWNPEQAVLVDLEATNNE